MTATPGAKGLKRGYHYHITANITPQLLFVTRLDYRPGPNDGLNWSLGKNGMNDSLASLFVRGPSYEETG